jgi:hypothetical protein
VHGTAEIARRPDWSSWSAPPAVVSRPRARPPMHRRMTARIGALGSTVRDLRSRPWGYVLMLLPAVLVVAALLAI